MIGSSISKFVTILCWNILYLETWSVAMSRMVNFDGYIYSNFTWRSYATGILSSTRFSISWHLINFWITCSYLIAYISEIDQNYWIRHIELSCTQNEEKHESRFFTENSTPGNSIFLFITSTNRDFRRNEFHTIRRYWTIYSGLEFSPSIYWDSIETIYYITLNFLSPRI